MKNTIFGCNLSHDLKIWNQSYDRNPKPGGDKNNLSSSEWRYWNNFTIWVINPKKFVQIVKNQVIDYTKIIDI